MFAQVSLSELAWLAAAILAAGIVPGILAGLFGIGGGAIIVPVLYEVFRILDVPEGARMQLCIGTSLAIIVPTSIRSYLAHREKDTTIRDVVRRWAWPAIGGVAVGSVLAGVAPSAVFKLVFIVVVTFIAIKLLFGRDSWRIADDLPGRFTMSCYGFLVGLCSSLMGVSGGSLSNLILTLYGRPIHNAVAISAGLGVPISLAGTAGYILAGIKFQDLLPPLSIGFVSLVGVVLMAPVSSFMAIYGARLAHALSKRHLEVALSIFLLLAAARFIISLV